MNETLINANAADFDKLRLPRLVLASIGQGGGGGTEVRECSRVLPNLLGRRGPTNGVHVDLLLLREGTLSCPYQQSGPLDSKVSGLTPGGNQVLRSSWHDESSMSPSSRIKRIECGRSIPWYTHTICSTRGVTLLSVPSPLRCKRRGIKKLDLPRPCIINAWRSALLCS